MDMNEIVSALCDIYVKLLNQDYEKLAKEVFALIQEIDKPK